MAQAACIPVYLYDLSFLRGICFEFNGNPLRARKPTQYVHQLTFGDSITKIITEGSTSQQSAGITFETL